MRTRFEDFAGEFVMHCHILDHEDAGMMQNTAIVSPATDFISRLTTTVLAAGERMQAWLKHAIGRRDDTALTLSAPICRAGSRIQIAARQ